MAILTVALAAVARTAGSQRSAAADDAEASGRNILEVALTPLYQNAIESGEDAGRYELDLIGSLLVFEGGNSVGPGRVVFYARGMDNLGGLQAASDMATKAGLLWPTNDADVSDFTAFLPLLA